MIKNLDWVQQDGDPEIKYMDTSTTLQMQLTVDGAPFDLNNATSLTINIANDDGFIISRDVDLSTVNDLSTGIINFPIDDDIMKTLTPDDYQVEVWAIIKPVMITTTATTATLTIVDDQLEAHTSIFPSDGIIGFTIGENLTNTNGDVVSTITFEDFQNKFNAIAQQAQAQINAVASDAEDKISTAVGPQGPKGDTGAIGPTGPVGPKGDKGDIGPQGLQGIQGPKGDKGDIGPTGKDGTSVNIKGAVDSPDKLPKTSNNVGDSYLITGNLYVWTGTAWTNAGNIQGPQGIKGDTGNGITSEIVAYQLSNKGTVPPTGQWSDTPLAQTTDNPYLWTQLTLNYTDKTKTVVYSVSLMGDTGPAGKDGKGLAIKGSVDTAGKLPTAGNSVGDGYLVAGHLYVWSGTVWTDAGNIQGPQGIQGIQGPKGDKGDTGPQGITGPKGDTGATGAVGAQGPAGKDGVTQDLSSFYHQNADDSSAQAAAKAATTAGIYWYPVSD